MRGTRSANRSGSTRPIRSVIFLRKYYKMGRLRPGFPGFRKEKTMRKLFIAAAVLPLLAFPGLAPADTSLGLRGGTLGGGAELSCAVRADYIELPPQVVARYLAH